MNYKPSHLGKKPVYLPYLIAPEVIEGMAYDNSCDIWSIGALTYFLLSGKLPFEDFDNSSIFEEIDSGIVDFKKEKAWEDVS